MSKVWEVVSLTDSQMRMFVQAMEAVDIDTLHLHPCRLVDAPEVHTAQITSWQEPDPDIYGKRTATIAEGRLWIETEYDSLGIGVPEGLQIVKREP